MCFVIPNFFGLGTLLWKYDNYYARAIWIVSFFMSWYWNLVFWLQLLRTAIAASFEYFICACSIFEWLNLPFKFFNIFPLIYICCTIYFIYDHSLKLNESFFIYINLPFKSTVYFNCQIDYLHALISIQIRLLVDQESESMDGSWVYGGSNFIQPTYMIKGIEQIVNDFSATSNSKRYSLYPFRLS